MGRARNMVRKKEGSAGRRQEAEESYSHRNGVTASSESKLTTLSPLTDGLSRRNRKESEVPQSCLTLWPHGL